MKGYPGWFPRLLFLTMAAVFLSGCLLIPSALFFRLEWDLPWKLGGGPRNLVGAIHVAVGLFITALLGAVWSIHIRHNWKLGLNQRSGLSVVIVLILLGLTGIGSMYLGGERTAPLNSVAHILIGLAAPALLTLHVIRGRRINSKPNGRGGRLAALMK